MDLQTKITQAIEIIQKGGCCPDVASLDCNLCAFKHNDMHLMCPDQDAMLVLAKAFLYDNAISIKNMEE